MTPIPGARGAFGEVWEGTYRGKRVAIKKPRSLDVNGQPIKYSEIDYDAQNGEYNRWAVLPPHPNILPVYGAFHDTALNSLWLISPLVPDGSLLQVMTNTDPPPWLDEHWIHLVLTHVAQGLSHLHNHQCLHLDCMSHGIFFFSLAPFFSINHDL
jgi:serine/threonine protein kinase